MILHQMIEVLEKTSLSDVDVMVPVDVAVDVDVEVEYYPLVVERRRDLF